MKHVRLLIIGMAAAVTLCASARAAVVFNNTTSPTGMVNALLPAGQSNSFEHANTVTLGGHERVVTNFTMRMRILGAGPATFSMRVRFYRNDGPAGSPGAMLWDSGTVNSVIDSGADLSYPLTVPDVRVPNSFTWSVQVTNRQINMAQMGPAEYNPPTVGSAPFGFWQNAGINIPDWQYVNANEPPFGATIHADTIPGDVNHDAQVNVDDLLNVINQWGSCGKCAVCPADVDGDCDVDIDDLLTTINNWG
jgi:hypothetical protein